MKRTDLSKVIDELANALQVAIGLALTIRRQSQATASEAVRLEAAITKAVSALKRLQPRH